MTDFFTPRQIGATPMQVPPLGFGAAWISPTNVPIYDAIETVQAAWDSGVRLFDTAPWYGIGRSERRLGVALAELDQPRDAYFVNTKVGRTLNPEWVEDPSNNTAAADGSARTARDSDSGFRVQFDYSFDAIKRQYRDSLQRLGVAKVNSLTLHDIDLGYHTAEQLEIVLHQLSNTGLAGAQALAELKQRNEIEAVGMGCNLETKNAFSWDDTLHEDLIERVFEIVDLDFVIIAGAYTLLETRAERRILPLCAKKNISVIIASPFAGGWLVNPTKMGYMYSKMSGLDAPDHIKSMTKEMLDVCAEFDVPIGAVALQFVLAHPVVVATIPGSATPGEARANRGFLDTDIPSELWQRLRERNLLPHDASVTNSN